jgi:hypothetical protein
MRVRQIGNATTGNDDASAVKTRIMTFWSIASRLLPQAATRSASYVNDEQYRPAGLTVCLALVSKRFGSRTSVRNFIRAGVKETVAMRLSGDRTRSVFDRYNIVSEDDLIDASTKLQQFLVEAIKDERVVPIKE